MAVNAILPGLYAFATLRADRVLAGSSVALFRSFPKLPEKPSHALPGGSLPTRAAGRRCAVPGSSRTSLPGSQHHRTVDC